MSYDDHEESEGGNARDDKYSVFYGKTTRAELWNNGSYGMSYAFLTSKSKNVRVRLDSDKYGKGKWRKPGRQVGNRWEGHSGVLYNAHDRLRVCVDGPNGSPVCGKWYDGTR